MVIDNIINPLNIHLSLKHVNSSGPDLGENFVQSVFDMLVRVWVL